MTEPLAQVDTALAALGSVPQDLPALIARYAGSERGLAQVDRVLEALGKNVAAPSNLAPTLIGIEVPAGLSVGLSAAPSAGTASGSEANEQRAAAEAASVEWAMDVPAAAAAAGATELVSAPSPVAAFPWDSIPPARARQAAGPSAHRSSPPQERAQLGLAGAAVAAAATDKHAVAREPTPSAADAADELLDPKRDTLEDASVVAAAPPEPQPAAAATAPATGDDDEFEIMVDDDLLEIAEDDVMIVDENAEQDATDDQ